MKPVIIVFTTLVLTLSACGQNRIGGYDGDLPPSPTKAGDVKR